MKKQYKKVTIQFDSEVLSHLERVSKYSGCTKEVITKVLLGLYIVEHENRSINEQKKKSEQVCQCKQVSANSSGCKTKKAN